MLPVGKGAVSTFAWSGDGKQIVYARVVGDSQGNPSFDLFVYDLEKRTNTRLTESENANTMAWRPGSSQVVYVSVKDGQDTIKLIDTKTKKTSTILKAENLDQYQQPAWSPDGLKLAVVTHKPGAFGSLILLDPLTGKKTEITKPQERVDDSNPVWTPDGKGLVFCSDRGGMTNLYTVDVATRAVTKLTNTYRGAEMPCLTPDGKAVLFTSYRAKGSDIFRMPLTKGTPVAASALAAPIAPVEFKPAKPPAANKPLQAAASELPPASAHALHAATTETSASANSAAPATATTTTATTTATTTPTTPATAPGAETKAAFDTPQAVKILDPSKSLPAPDIAIGDAKPYAPTLTNDMLLPQMTSDEKGQQVGVAGTYSDILNKHQLGFDVRYGIMSQRFSYMLQYVNHMWGSSWMVSMYDQPNIAITPDVGVNGHTVYDALYFQRQRGASLGVMTPLGGGRSLYSAASFGTLSTLSNPREGNFGQLREGQLNTLTLGYQEQNVTNTIDMDINPSDGYRLGLSWVLSDGAFGSKYDFSQYMFQGERYFSILPEHRHNLAWHWNLGMINGESVQPFMVGGATGTNPVFALRGYAVGQLSGNRVATTGLEYTAPIFQHIDKMFGPLYLDRLYVTGFSDVGAAWNQGAAANPYASYGAELRLRTTVMGRQMLTLRFGLAKKLGSADAPGFYLAF
jgi:hypothetical protein